MEICALVELLSSLKAHNLVITQLIMSFCCFQEPLRLLRAFSRLKKLLRCRELSKSSLKHSRPSLSEWISSTQILQLIKSDFPALHPYTKPLILFMLITVHQLPTTCQGSSPPPACLIFLYNFEFIVNLFRLILEFRSLLLFLGLKSRDTTILF